MNRVPNVAFRLVVAALLLCSGTSRMRAQSAPAKQDTTKQDATKSEKGNDQGDAKEDDASASLRRRVATNVGQQGLLHVRRR